MSPLRRLGALLTALALTGCALAPSPQERRALADELAHQKGWQAESIAAEPFTLLAYRPLRVVPVETLTVYIEGDGLAWLDGSTPSPDPTPRQPLALKLALAHPGANAAYLARPCQFRGDAEAGRCSQAYWTNKRFAPEVIAASNSAVDVLKAQFGARHIQLVGYSGGGAVAALVAARRQDVSLLVTVAGNLDTQAWTRLMRISPLTGSLNPADARAQLAHIRQVHYSGEADQVVPPAMAEAFVAGFWNAPRPEIRVIKGYGHTCCWAENWTSLWNAIQ
ncbi:MAG: alpha/beta hydrolase [Pseudomonadota bacterium]